MTILGIGVVARMMAWGLDKSYALKQRNEEPVLTRRPMCPLMDLVRINAKNHDQPNLPTKGANQPGHRQHHESKTQKDP